jgi:hypothetical protein
MSPLTEATLTVAAFYLCLFGLGVLVGMAL